MLPVDGFEGEMRDFGIWILDLKIGGMVCLHLVILRPPRLDGGTRHAVSLRLHQPYGGHRDLCPGNHRVSMSDSGKEDGG